MGSLLKTASEILLDLISIPSVSTLSNRPVIEYALEYLDPASWTIRLYESQPAGGLPKINLVATTLPVNQVPELTLVCHTDTVPFDPGWTEATRPVERDGKIYGRGSCDVKGFLACILAAVGRIDVQNLARPLSIVLSADEEIGCLGAKYLAKQGAVQSRYMIVGEPTGLRAAYASKGYALAEIVVRGKEAHSAYPDRGRSAIRDAARILKRLDVVASRLAAERNPAFDPPYTTLNVGLIQGGSAKNIIPGECRITVEWRPVPGPDPSDAAAWIEEELAKFSREIPGFHAEMNIQRLDAPFQPKLTRHLEKLVGSYTGRPTTTISFGTEAGHLGAGSFETVVFGPGDMTVAHKNGEFVPVKELLECVNCLVKTIETLCAP